MVSGLSTSTFDEEGVPNAASEKELGNEYFKHKKYKEAIDCYSRSIALSPTCVAFANRAMAYLNFRRFEEAESDCTEALNLDDCYVKAYSRRATARKELGKLQLSLEDSEFALRLEPNNQELKRLHVETKILYDKEVDRKLKMETSVLELASQAASRALTAAAKNITAPRSAYEFEVYWRGLSDDPVSQARLLKGRNGSCCQHSG